MYFVYGIHNSRLQQDLDEMEGPDMGEFPGPVGTQS
jgi:hypothetical protein